MRNEPLGREQYARQKASEDQETAILSALCPAGSVGASRDRVCCGVSCKSTCVQNSIHPLSLSFSGSTSSLCVRSLSTNLKEQKPTSFHVHRGHQALGIMTMRTTRRTNDVREGKRLFPLPFTEHEMDFQSEFACLRLLCPLPVPVIPDEQTGSNLRAITQRDELTDNRPRPFSLPLQSKSPFSSLPPPSLPPSLPASRRLLRALIRLQPGNSLKLLSVLVPFCL